MNSKEYIDQTEKRESQNDKFTGVVQSDVFQDGNSDLNGIFDNCSVFGETVEERSGSIRRQ